MYLTRGLMEDSAVPGDVLPPSHNIVRAHRTLCPTNGGECCGEEGGWDWMGTGQVPPPLGQAVVRSQLPPSTRLWAQPGLVPVACLGHHQFAFKGGGGQPYGGGGGS